MQKTLEIELADHGDRIALAIEEAHNDLRCSQIAVGVCACAMAWQIARATR